MVSSAAFWLKFVLKMMIGNEVRKAEGAAIARAN